VRYTLMLGKCRNPSEGRRLRSPYAAEGFFITPGNVKHGRLKRKLATLRSTATKASFIRLKPTSRRFVPAGLKSGPPGGSRSPRGTTNQESISREPIAGTIFQIRRLRRSELPVNRQAGAIFDRKTRSRFHRRGEGATPSSRQSVSFGDAPATGLAENPHRGRLS